MTSFSYDLLTGVELVPARGSMDSTSLNGCDDILEHFSISLMVSLCLNVDWEDQLLLFYLYNYILKRNICSTRAIFRDKLLKHSFWWAVSFSFLKFGIDSFLSRTFYIHDLVQWCANSKRFVQYLNSFFIFFSTQHDTHTHTHTYIYIYIFLKSGRTVGGIWFFCLS